MKILTATTRTQGQRTSDFTWCVEGEVVTADKIICARDERDGPDGGCGCGRSWSGLNSHLSTTTAMVRDIDGFTFEDLTEAVRSFREQAGWLDMMADSDAEIAEEAARIAEIAAEYPDGAVLETRMGEIAERSA